jgi:hypothetical protein
VLAPAIARFRVVLYSLAPLSAKLISHKNQAVAGGSCAFVRLFDQVSHISPLQLALSTSIAPPINDLLFASGLLSPGSSSHWGFAAAPDVSSANLCFPVSDSSSSVESHKTSPRRMTLQLADHCRARRKRRLRMSGAMAELRHIPCSHQRQESLLKVGPAQVAVTMRNVRWGNEEIYPLVSRIPQALCGFSHISNAQRATLFNRTWVATLWARKGR